MNDPSLRHTAQLAVDGLLTDNLPKTCDAASTVNMVTVIVKPVSDVQFSTENE